MPTKPTSSEMGADGKDAVLTTFLHAQLPTQGGLRTVELRLPRLADVLDLLSEDGVRDAHVVAAWLPGFIHEMVRSVAGEDMDFARAQALAGDGLFVRALLLHVRSGLDRLRESGQVHGLCPRCGLWEAALDIQALALVVSGPVPSTFDGPLWRSPWMSAAVGRAPARPPLPASARFRLVLPSTRLGLPGALDGFCLGAVRAQPEEADSAGVGQGFDETAELRSGAAWCAALRLSRALSPPLPDGLIDDLPLVDFLFVDLVHYLVDRADMPEASRAQLQCPRCGTHFLPVRHGPPD